MLGLPNELPTSLLGLLILLVVYQSVFAWWQARAVIQLVHKGDKRMDSILLFVQNHMEHDQTTLTEIKGYMGAQTEIMRVIQNSVIIPAGAKAKVEISEGSKT